MLRLGRARRSGGGIPTMPLPAPALSPGSRPLPVVRTLRFATLALLAILLAGAFSPHHAYAWTASGPLLPNGSALGLGSATTYTDGGARIAMSLQGAKSNATYAIFSCIGLFAGDFNCTSRNLPQTVQQV